MALSREDAQTISALVPVALQVGRLVFSLAEKARSEGYTIPNREALEESNAQLKALEDLGDDQHG